MPLALAAPELLVVVVLALLLVLLLVNLQLYQNGRQARSFVSGWPVISGLAVTAIDWILAFDVQAVRFIDDAIGHLLISAVQAFGRLVVLSFNLAGAAILALIHHTAAIAA